MEEIDLPDYFPATAIYDTENNIVRVTYKGLVAPGEITQVSKSIAKSKFFSKDLPALVDFSQCSIKTDVEATMGFIEYLKSISDELGHPKWAIITGSELNAAMHRRLIFLADDLPIEMKEFDSINQAISWLTT